MGFFSCLFVVCFFVGFGFALVWFFKLMSFILGNMRLGGELSRSAALFPVDCNSTTLYKGRVHISFLSAEMSTILLLTQGNACSAFLIV